MAPDPLRARARGTGPSLAFHTIGVKGYYNIVQPPLWEILGSAPDFTTHNFIYQLSLRVKSNCLHSRWTEGERNKKYCKCKDSRGVCKWSSSQKISNPAKHITHGVDKDKNRRVSGSYWQDCLCVLCTYQFIRVNCTVWLRWTYVWFQ